MAMPIPSAEYWTAADLDNMPEDGLRYEVLNGQLIVSPAPKPRHQLVIKWLEKALDLVCPPKLMVVEGMGVLIGEDEAIPDLMVVTGRFDVDGRGVPAEQVLLAVEMVSKSTTATDRKVKPDLYAAAGIPNYWRVEINSFKGRLPGERLPVLFAYSLAADGAYVLTHRVSAAGKVDLLDPFAVTVAPADAERFLDFPE